MTLEGFHAILPHVDTFLSAGLCGFQCVLASGVLFVPDTPAGGWTGEQVLGSSGHGALYILSQQDYPQVKHSCSVFYVMRGRQQCCRYIAYNNGCDGVGVLFLIEYSFQ